MKLWKGKNIEAFLSEILIKLRDFHLSQKNPSLDIKIHSTNHTRIFSLALPLRPSLQETCDNFANLSLLFGGKRFYEEDNVLDDPSLEKGRIALENQDEPTITVITIVRNNSLGLRKNNRKRFISKLAQTRVSSNRWNSYRGKTG